jgi:hypothetical protein
VVYVGNDGEITNELTVHELQSEQGRGDQSPGSPACAAVARAGVESRTGEPSVLSRKFASYFLRCHSERAKRVKNLCICFLNT